MDQRFFDIVCTLPLSSDLISLAVHPLEPLVAVGLASGHIQTFRLPTITDSQPASARTTSDHIASPHKDNVSHQVTFSDEVTDSPGRPARRSDKKLRSSLLQPPTSDGTRQGCGMIETVWKTRRHKGSCRALAFSTDGDTLFSAGTDGILKAADSEKGHVIGKALIPGKASSQRKGGAHPSKILLLNPKCLVLGDDEGGVHEYELHEVGLKSSDTVNGVHASTTRLAPCTAEPKKVYYPHRTKENPGAAEPITSMTALPPSGASTSGESRQWVTTAGSTLAVCDVFKGSVGCSDEQQGGGEPLELLSSACLAQNPVSDKYVEQDKTRKHGNAQKTSLPTEAAVTLVVGDSAGGCSFWSRGQWQSPSRYRRLRQTNLVEGLPLEDYGVECVAVMALREESAQPLIATGLATGQVHFLVLEKSGKISDTGIVQKHDESGLDGCTAIAFDVEGRMITGGGSTIRVWHKERGQLDVPELKYSSIEETDGSESVESSDIGGDALPSTNGASGKRKIDGDHDDNLESSDSGSDSDMSDKKSRPKKRSKKRKVNKGRKVLTDGRGDHGIMKFSGLG